MMERRRFGLRKRLHCGFAAAAIVVTSILLCAVYLLETLSTGISLNLLLPLLILLFFSAASILAISAAVGGAIVKRIERLQECMERLARLVGREPSQLPGLQVSS
jgi:cobalamin biosynthesis protein CobD/CbiB